MIKEEYNLKLYAAHVNHCLRGEEADKDEEYVKEFCRSLGIECFAKRIKLDDYAKEKGLSTESAGREVRYEFFQEIFKNVNADKIALAHNANDQAETVLMRIIRGSGMEGITGIKPVRGNIFIRPIININRGNIEDYCNINNLMPRIDKTNLESIYTRNKIRLELIPYIANNFNEDIVSVLNRLADTIGKDNEYLETLSNEKYKTYCRKNGNKVIIDKEIFTEHEAILTRVIRKAVNELKGNLYNVGKVHIYDLIKLQKSGTGKKINLPDNIIGFNNYGNVELFMREYSSNKEDIKEHTLYIESNNYIEEFSINISMKLVSVTEKINFKESEDVKYFDFDKIKGQISIRKRRNGDRFTPFGMSGSKKLKDLFIDMKVPQMERDRIPLVCFGEDIGWIVGYRISDNYKVDKTTKNILEIKIKKQIYA
jgi:tRNA(Ile)-lysidine synthase